MVGFRNSKHEIRNSANRIQEVPTHDRSPTTSLFFEFRASHFEFSPHRRCLMPSPFPGMDPFLEPFWGDVHASLIIYTRNQLQRLLPSGLVAGVEQYVSLEIDERPTRFRPDVAVLRTRDSEQASSTATLEADEPYLADEPEVHRGIRIEDREGRLVTTIEFLSPANKKSQTDRDVFHRRQVEFLKQGVNLVEVDLLVPGVWTVFVDEELIPYQCRSPYRICVVRSERLERPECYAAPLQKALPRIRIPLRDGDRDVVLHLQDLVARTWDDGAYAKRIDYAHDPVPALSAADEAWMIELLASQGITRPRGAA